MCVCVCVVVVVVILLLQITPKIAYFMTYFNKLLQKVAVYTIVQMLHNENIKTKILAILIQLSIYL